MARIGVQPMPPRRLPNCNGIEPCRLHKHVLRLRRDHRVPSTHHARQAQRLLVIGHHKVIRVQHALHSVQRLQPLALARPPHYDPSLNLVQIEGVCRLAHRQPCEVGRIHGIQNHLLLEQREIRRNLSAREPVARLADRHIAQHTRSKPPALVLGLNPHRKWLAGRSRIRQRVPQFRQLQPIDRRRLASNAVVIHRVHAVRGDVHLVNRTIVDRAVRLAERINPFHRDPTQSQILG